MAHQAISIVASVPPLTTTRHTTPIDHDATTLLETRWFHASGGSQILYSAWLHPDTAAPSLDDPGNIMITQETPFEGKEAITNIELLPQCRQIPSTHKNMTMQVRNTSAAIAADASVTYIFA